MTERTVAQAFPGATALTVLDVYDWIAPDGMAGGSAHVHLASAEGYVVLAGQGRLQTLGGAEGYAETELKPGEVLWFTPGIIHRLVNEGGLRLLVVMQNAGLPEAGDAVLTFPPEVLADPERYAEAAALPAPGAPARDVEDAARRRRDLAIEGYLALRDGGSSALEAFYAAAVRLAGGRVPQWRERWQAGALGAALATGGQLDRLAEADGAYLAGGVLRRGGQEAPGYGMCGRLRRVSP